ncbi:helix-turn-helix domain-containing protein [Actinomadura kijaniata]|uniref:helix-turn-helix domain-containing protein n=1 Tax=Actinomadura kijaniata TaxID=46161 RepID=UPI00350E4672
MLAEELRFGRTAERLHVTPSRVSHAIKKAERRIGGPLFEHTSRTVRPTPLGERLRDDLLSTSPTRPPATGDRGSVGPGRLITARRPAGWAVPREPPRHRRGSRTRPAGCARARGWPEGT